MGTCTLITLMYVLLITPYRLAFKAETAMFLVLGSALDVFFLCDVVLNFFTTSEDENRRTITDHPTLACAYLKSWFTVDFVSSVPLQWVPVQTSSSADASVVVLMRAVKLLKLMKLLRVTRFKRLLSKVQEQLGWKHSTVTTVEYMLILFITAHWLGCLYFLFASQALDPETGKQSSRVKRT